MSFPTVCNMFTVGASIARPKHKLNQSKSRFSIYHKKRNYNFIIKSLGITIKIIRDPISSDLDGSKRIDLKEAIYLRNCTFLRFNWYWNWRKHCRLKFYYVSSFCCRFSINIFIAWKLPRKENSFYYKATKEYLVYNFWNFTNFNWNI